MAQASIFTNFDMYDQLGDWTGEIDEIVTPKVAQKMIEYHASGMAGPLDVAVGHEKLEAEITNTGINPRIFAAFAHCDAKGKPIRIVGAYKKTGGCGYDSVEIQLLAKPKEFDLGTFKKGDAVPVKTSYAVSYYLLTINSIPMVEIDIINNIYKVLGIDLLEKEREALGK